MQKIDDDLTRRVAALEDLEEIRSTVMEFETLKGGVERTKVDDLVGYFTEDVKFTNLEGRIIEGRGRLREYLSQGSAGRVWDRHVLTNLIVRVRGKRATALYLITGEGLSWKGDSSKSLVHSNTKSTKLVTLRRNTEGWLICEYKTKMDRVTTEKVQA